MINTNAIDKYINKKIEEMHVERMMFEMLDEV